MKRRTAPLLFALTGALLAPAALYAAEEAQPAPAVEGAKSCVSLHAIRTTRVLDERTIVFEMSGKKMMVNRLPRRCPGLGFEKRFAYKTSLSQLCSQDIITVITDIGRGASCGLGKFEPYVPPEPEAGKPGDGKLEPVTNP